MRSSVVLVALAACGSPPPPSSPAPERPVAPVAAPADAPAPDAGLPDEVATAPAWIFRYNTPDRTETWTLRYHGDTALLVVEAKQGTVRYVGTVTEGASLTLALAAGPNRLTLDCKHEKMSLSGKCNDRKAAKQDVFNCYHPDYKAPMTFGPAPGVEYVAGSDCSGFRLIQKQ
jgi:hypothetical protein